MYDKGFSAIEKSHQRTMMEMRRTHRQELDRIREEKDQLLQEEAEATQAGRISHDALSINLLTVSISVLVSVANAAEHSFAANCLRRLINWHSTFGASLHRFCFCFP